MPPTLTKLVKPLVWDGNVANTAFGQYRIMKTQNRDNDKYMVTYLDPCRKSHTLGYIDGQPSSKSAADADHAARVIAALDGELLAAACDALGYECEECGHLCGDPDRDLALIRRAGGVSCCPERNMRPLSAAILARLGVTP